jgi:polyisoprenyl-phosphate glycosyltransferase
MAKYPVFLSVVVVLRNSLSHLRAVLAEIETAIQDEVSDYEIIVVDNGSNDDSVSELKRLTAIDGLSNVQVFALTKEIDPDTAAWVGLDNALGDFVAVLEPGLSAPHLLIPMLDSATNGIDVVFANNRLKASQSILYRFLNAGFQRLFGWFNGVNLAEDAPKFRLLSRKVVNFLSQHPQPELSYRHLPASAGFSKVVLNYSAEPRLVAKANIFESIDNGVRLLVSTTRAPMRLVSALSLFGAIANIIYSIYVLAIALFKTNVAEGWVSLSLQQSGMFFLLSLVLFVLGEYILNMARLSHEGPVYHVAQEFVSARITRNEKLNVEVSTDQLAAQFPPR